MTTALAPFKINWLTLVLWFLANIVSFGLAGAFFHNFPLAFAFAPDVTHLGAFSLLPAIVGLIFGAIPALLIGWSQWMLLRRSLPLSRWWIVSVSAGMGLMHFLSDGFENARDLSPAVLISGLLGRCCMNPFKPALAVADWGHAAT